MIRYLVADDHELYREGLMHFLSRQPGLQLLGEAENGKVLLEKALEFEPELIITDISMPGMDGITATRQLLTQLPNTRIIGLSMHQDESLVVEMLEAGARGYLLKNADKHDILEAIEAVMQGACWFCHRSSGRLTKLIASSRFDLLALQQDIRFTSREKEIIRLTCREYSSREIGEALHISHRTVEGIRAGILSKMNVRNTVGLAVFALRHGLITGEDLQD